jgi:hypothetical protein
MPTELQKLAAYYSDVLTALSENFDRVLRDLSLGRSYGLGADLSPLGVSANDLLLSPAIYIDKIIPDLTSDDAFTAEPEGYESLAENLG